MRAFKFPALFTFTLLLALSHSALSDPPGRVGRLSYLEGAVSFHAAQQADWAQATPNYPLTTGDSLWTDANARAEIQIGSTEIYLDQGTELDFLQLDDSAIQVNVPQGSVNIHFDIVPLNGDVTVITPVGDITLNRPGTYRIDAGQPNGNSASNQLQVTTLAGEALLTRPVVTQVMANQTLIITGNPFNQIFEAGVVTAFDSWAAQRNAPLPTAIAKYVSPQMTGYEDLTSYGSWSTEVSYGTVWYPANVAADWAPYRYGHWVYRQPWGYTWVDDAPWGFAPFHYGRWAYLHNRWGWVPGPVAPRPVYAPALVTFVSTVPERLPSRPLGTFGPAGTVTFGPVGWIPLGPNEIFTPYYKVGSGYVTRINNGRKHRHDQTYVNRNAATTVPAATLQNARPVHQTIIANVPHETIIAKPAAVLSQLPPAPAAQLGGNPVNPGVRPHPSHNAPTNSAHVKNNNMPTPPAVTPAAVPPAAPVPDLPQSIAPQPAVAAAPTAPDDQSAIVPVKPGAMHRPTITHPVTPPTAIETPQPVAPVTTPPIVQPHPVEIPAVTTPPVPKPASPTPALPMPVAPVVAPHPVTAPSVTPPAVVQPPMANTPAPEKSPPVSVITERPHPGVAVRENPRRPQELETMRNRNNDRGAPNPAPDNLNNNNDAPAAPDNTAAP